MDREQRLAEAFVGLSDTLADDVDPVMLMDRLAGHCVEIIGADGVGIMMATSRGDLRTMAVTDERTGFLELLELQAGEGPCLECYRKGMPVDSRDLDAQTDRWPEWAPLARRFGFRSAHALPLRVNHETIGAVNLLLDSPGGLPQGDLGLAQALADVAALALIHWNAERTRPSDIHTRLQVTIAAKSTVDMATGMVAEYSGLNPSAALSALHVYAAGNNCRLIDTARALVQRTLRLEEVLGASR
ncbi:GAF domain-containing protein [Streptomyces sp. NPDC005485]|uniref:GAF domain-containing protein n=1 Tax=Streptomyces sp. NPDC005485 TaxID=3155591 RepID=UPI0033ADB64A